MKIKKINEGFLCSNCHKEVPPVEASCRNHCNHCLCSLHVDEEIPGDRLSPCQGKMIPLRVDWNGKKGYVITHECLSCKKQMKNKCAEDDNTDKLIHLMHDANPL